MYNGCFCTKCVATVKPSQPPAERGRAHRVRSADLRMGCRRGALGWLYPFEIQPLETRPAGGAVASLMNLLFSFVIGQALHTHAGPYPVLSFTSMTKAWREQHTICWKALAQLQDVYCKRVVSECIW